MMLRTVIYALLLATLCVGCGGRISMRQLQEFYSDTSRGIYIKDGRKIAVN